jgi:hypothetical protein
MVRKADGDGRRQTHMHALGRAERERDCKWYMRTLKSKLSSFDSLRKLRDIYRKVWMRSPKHADNCNLSAQTPTFPLVLKLEFTRIKTPNSPHFSCTEEVLK